MWKVEMASLPISLMLVTTPTVADVTSELTRCKLEAERDKGAKNWADRAANLQKMGRGCRNVHAGGRLQRYCRMFCSPQDLRKLYEDR